MIPTTGNSLLLIRRENEKNIPRLAPTTSAAAMPNKKGSTAAFHPPGDGEAGNGTLPVCSSITPALLRKNRCII